MDNIKLYTLITCPKCAIIKQKLRAAGVTYEEINNAKEVSKYLEENHLTNEVPFLQIEGEKPMDFLSILTWIRQRKGG